MKKTFLLLLLTILCFPAFSEENKKRSSIGFRLSYINSWVSDPKFNSDLRYDRRKAFSLGMLYNRKINKSFSWQTEVLFSLKGYSIIGNARFSYHSNYLELPILIKAELPGKITPYINTGLSPAFSIGPDYLISDTYSKFDLNIIASIGLDIKLSKKTVMFAEMRISPGIIKSHHRKSTYWATEGKFSNNSFYATLGIRF